MPSPKAPDGLTVSVISSNASAHTRPVEHWGDVSPWGDLSGSWRPQGGRRPGQASFTGLGRLDRQSQGRQEAAVEMRVQGSQTLASGLGRVAPCCASRRAFGTTCASIIRDAIGSPCLFGCMAGKTHTYLMQLLEDLIFGECDLILSASCSRSWSRRQGKQKGGNGGA